MKKKVIIGSVASAVLVGLTSLVLQVRSSSLQQGKVEGCTQLANSVISPLFQPQCSIVDDSLRLTVSTPVGELTYDVATGLLVE